jgi:hypothetical protein
MLAAMARPGGSRAGKDHRGEKTKNQKNALGHRFLGEKTLSHDSVAWSKLFFNRFKWV